jgi:hypothetical protein
MSTDFKVVAVAYGESASLTVELGSTSDYRLVWSSNHLPVLNDHLLLDYTVRTYTYRSVMCKYLHIWMDEGAYPNKMKSLEHISCFVCDVRRLTTPNCHITLVYDAPQRDC